MKYTEGNISALLAKRFSAPEYAYFASVPDTTGGGATRIADGVAMNLYPSKGLALTCFEIKVTRSDLMAELKDLTKGECIGKYCDYFVLVLPKGIVSAKELPDHWGLMEVNGERLQYARNPKKQEHVAPLDRGFVASLLRRACGGSEESDLVRTLTLKEQEIDRKIYHYETLIKSATTHRESQEASLKKEIKEFEERQRLFHEASGLFAFGHSWSGDVHPLIRVFLECASKKRLFQDITAAYGQIMELQQSLGRIVEEYNKIEKE